MQRFVVTPEAVLSSSANRCREATRWLKYRWCQAASVSDSDNVESLWGFVKIKPEVFDISGGWIASDINGRNSLTIDEYVMTLSRMHVNTGQIEEVPGYTDNPERYNRFPFKRFNRMQDLSRYDTDNCYRPSTRLNSSASRSTEEGDRFHHRKSGNCSLRIKPVGYRRVSRSAMNARGAMFPDLIEPITRVNREIRMVDEILLTGDAFEHRRIEKDGIPDWEINSVVAPNAALLIIHDVGYRPNPTDNTFRFQRRKAALPFNLPTWLSTAGSVFALDADGVHDVDHSIVDGKVTIQDDVHVVGIYVVT